MDYGDLASLAAARKDGVRFSWPLRATERPGLRGDDGTTTIGTDKSQAELGLTSREIRPYNTRTDLGMLLLTQEKPIGAGTTLRVDTY